MALPVATEAQALKLTTEVEKLEANVAEAEQHVTPSEYLGTFVIDLMDEELSQLVGAIMRGDIDDPYIIPSSLLNGGEAIQKIYQGIPLTCIAEQEGQYYVSNSYPRILSEHSDIINPLGTDLVLYVQTLYHGEDYSVRLFLDLTKQAFVMQYTGGWEVEY